MSSPEKVVLPVPEQPKLKKYSRKYQRDKISAWFFTTEENGRKTEKTEKGKEMQDLCAGWAVDFCTIFFVYRATAR